MEKYQLTFPQLSLWSVEQFYKGTSINVITGFIKINETVNFHLFNDAIEILIKNTDIFGMHLSYENGELTQVLTTPKNKGIRLINVSCKEELENLQNTIAKTPFNIFEDDLFDFTIFKLPDNTGGVIGRFHHIICDAWATSLIITRIMTIYQNLLNNLSPTEGINFESYVNYIVSEELYVNSPKFKKSKEFWLNTFNSNFSYSYLSSNVSNSCTADRATYSIEKNLAKKLNDFCEVNSISLPLLLISVIGIYLAKINNNSCATIGLPILNRTNFKEKNSIGAFISTIPFKMDIDYNKTYLNFILDLKKDYFNILRNQKYPYTAILEDLRKTTNISKSLYDISFSYQNARDNNQLSSINYTTGWVFNGCVSNNMDIHIYDMDNTGDLSILFDYRKDLFKASDVEEIYNNLINILNQIISNPNILLNDISSIDKNVENFITNNYNNTKAEFPGNTPIIKLFEEQAKLSYTKLALIEGEKELTYAELLNSVNNLAYNLSKNGLKYQDKVCLFFDNSIELVVSILACLKLGVCYIPLNTSFPFERVKYIMNDSNSAKILTNSKNISKLAEFNNSIVIDYENLNFEAKHSYNEKLLNSNDLVYIIYTSGSTGNPKGVQIANKSLVNYIYWCTKQYVTTTPCNFPLYSSIAFDLTVTSIYTPLISGNSIYIYNNSNPELLIKEIVADKKIQVLKLTPAHLSLLLDVATPDSCIKELIVGGDILTTETCKAIINKFHNGIKIYNEYGPTEATVGCMIYEYSLLDDYVSVPIGKPINNVQIYLFNSCMNLMPFNTIGEMYIGGDCLSKGYLNLPTVTENSFIKNPFNENEILYKTGDLAKLHPNGSMEYIGRCDFQIKINGYRIETGEVQSQILKYPNIKDCYVIDMQIKNNKELCAYYVENKHVDIDDLISTLDKKLPNYMIPKHFIKMGSLPMTVNGKINRKELPLPTIKRKVAIVKPANTIEELLCNIFCKVLEIEEISTVENIFNYYVDSLSLIKIQTILYSEGYNLDTQDFYNNKTIKSLADKIINGSASEEDYAENFKDVNFSISDIQKDITTNINFKNIFLFGATGFLGIHILHELLLNTNSNIYCLIRRKNGSIPRQRLEEKLKFYFPNENLEKYKDRIIILEGNLLDEHFGLDKVVYNKLIRDIDICIHSAALVKHYGDYNLFHQTNVVSTEKIIDFCNEGHSVLEYISTISVSGYGLVNTPDTTFTENNLYIGQNYKENVYVHSKFEAEYLIIEACKNTNLIASIYRVGNLSNRYTDGVFQENSYENSSLNRIIACINLNCYPKEFQTFPLEFSPVDICAHNIVKLLPDQNKNLNIYHLYNNNVTNFLNIQHLLEKNNIYLKAISSEDFKKLLIEQSNNYFGFANIINNKVTSNLNISNEYTDSILKKLNLNWPIIDDLYIQKIIDYLIKNKFIGEKTNETRKE